MIRLILCILLTASLSACGFSVGLGGIKRDKTIDLGPTLAEIPRVEILPAQPLQAKSLEQISAAYNRALAISDNVQINQRILMRLADLNLILTEERMIETAEAKLYFEDVVTIYQALLQTSEDVGVDPARRQQLQYQLAKAYALDGRMEESMQALGGVAAFGDLNDELLVEAQFRRAEFAFSNGEYEKAKADFNEVLLSGESSFYNNALYMRGWSEFKLSEFQASVSTFTLLLDRYATTDSTLVKLPASAATLVEDSLRAMSLAFSYLDGGLSIASTYKQLGPRDYEYLLYQRLGEFYFKQERYRDAAETYNTFVGLYPFSRYSPDFTVRTIDVYTVANFPALALDQKQLYLDRYGIDNPFYLAAEPADREVLNGYLHKYLIELATYVHAEAQALAKQKQRSRKIKELDVTNRFLDAAGRYDQFVRTFPQDAKTPEMVYLMAEAFADAKAYVNAANAFERAAYDYLDTSYSQLRAPDAAYAAILMSDEVLKQLSDGDAKQDWRLRKTALSLRFADVFSTDFRAASVLTSAAQQLLAANKPEQAVAAAYRIVDWVPLPDGELLRTAWHVAAMANFDLERFSAAESAFSETLILLDANDPLQASLEENLAASIYKQGEQHAVNSEFQAAVNDFFRIHLLLPEQPLAAQGYFDALNYLVELKEWQQAESAASEFTRKYPKHELAKLIPAKRLLIYEQSEQWGKAASQLYRIHLKDKDPEVKRTSLYIAGEYALKADDTEQAIQYFRRYAHAYSEPFDALIEAQYQMVKLYQKTQDAYKERYWLKKIIGATKRRSKATPRSDYLRSYALMTLAEDSYIEFTAAKLKLPLKTSLKIKRRTMENCTDAYAEVMKLGIEEFTTKANFRMAEVYLVLSTDLMDSPRPTNLDALALEQYEILLEEQAFPFEEKGIQLHEANSQRGKSGFYDEWVKRSFQSLASILPARYGKQEQTLEYSDAIF